MNSEIYRTIKKRILFLEYKPGHILNEKVLAEEFGVSRTPLREVLSRLEWEQLVKIIPRSGSIVSEIEFQKMMHVFQIRFEVEGLVGRLAAERITSDHLDNIAKIREECNQLLDREDRKALWDVDLTFRDILYDAANNPVLRDMSQYLYNLTVRLWYITSARGDWGEEVRPLLNEIEQTLDAFSRKDLEAAGRTRRECLIDHFERIRNKFIGASSKISTGQ
jgi:DNA-binding GntR family transcriptional regulator